MKKVLIVEDDKWLAENFELILQSDGWSATVCCDAFRAIDEIDDFRPDVILLDFLLPGASAVGLLNELKSHDDIKNLPVVLCSSLKITEDLTHYGVVAVLDKTTMTPQSLVAALGEATHATT